MNNITNRKLIEELNSGGGGGGGAFVKKSVELTGDLRVVKELDGSSWTVPATSNIVIYDNNNEIIVDGYVIDDGIATSGTGIFYVTIPIAEIGITEKYNIIQTSFVMSGNTEVNKVDHGIASIENDKIKFTLRATGTLSVGKISLSGVIPKL